MVELRRSKFSKTKLFQVVTIIMAVSSFIACSQAHTPSSVTWNKPNTVIKKPVDLLNNGTDTNGVNAAGYLSLGMLATKNINRAVGVALGTDTRTEKCESPSPTSRGTDGPVSVEVSTSKAMGDCRGWTNDEKFTGSISGGVLTALSKTDSGTSSGLQYQDQTNSPRATHLTLTEKYALTPVSGKKTVYTFVYDGTVDFNYVNSAAPMRNIMKPAPVANGKYTGGTNDDGYNNGQPYNQNPQYANGQPQPMNGPASPRPVVGGTYYDLSAKIHAEGTYDATNANSPVVTFNASNNSQSFVHVDYYQSDSSNSSAPENTFSSDVSLAQATSALPTTCGVPTGSFSLTQHFVAHDVVKSGDFKPVLAIQNNQISSADTKFNNLFLPCQPNTGLNDMKALIRNASVKIPQ